MSRRLAGRVCLVTGAARGIGAAIATRFVAEGAVVCIGDVAVADGKAVASRLGARFIELDVTDEAAWERAVAEVLSEHGRLDVLVNNAGIAPAQSLARTATDEFVAVMMVNQVGVFLGLRSAIEPMRRSGGGSIINLSSILGLTGGANFGAYVASKFAVRGMTKTAALELADAGIRVNSIHPGFVRTAMIDGAAQGDADRLIAPMVPLRRVAEPEEIAHLAVFLASDESSYATGAEFVLDGGLTAGVPAASHGRR